MNSQNRRFHVSLRARRSNPPFFMQISNDSAYSGTKCFGERLSRPCQRMHCLAQVSYRCACYSVLKWEVHYLLRLAQPRSQYFFCKATLSENPPYFLVQFSPTELATPVERYLSTLLVNRYSGNGSQYLSICYLI